MSIEIGSYLREAREKAGLTLDQIQEMTKIQKSFIIAIEKGEFQKLPSPFYVRTYLRSYANCVKVEPHHILRQYRKEEQAERGLTGTHKVVSDTLPEALPNSQVVGNARVPSNMALTVAQSKDEQLVPPLHSERAKKEKARRSVGYQGVQNSISKANPALHNSQTEWISVEKEILTWSSSDQMQVTQPRLPVRQASSRFATLNQSTTSSSPKEKNEAFCLKRSKLKRNKNTSFTPIAIGISISVFFGAIGLLYVLYKLKYL